MRRVETTAWIDADPAHVWAVLTDFAEYPRWSPTLRRISGGLAEGGRLTVTAVGPVGRPVTFRPTVLTVRPGRVLRWRARLAPGVLTGVHEFVLEPAEGATRLVHADNFTGIATYPLGRLLTRNEATMHAQNAALKRRVESLYGIRP